MATCKIKKGDTVKVIAGKDKDREGKVISVDPKNGKVLVEGINLIKKSEKPSAANQNGGIIQKEAPIDLSNVMLMFKGEAVRVGIKRVDDEKRPGKTKAIRVVTGNNSHKGEEID